MEQFQKLEEVRKNVANIISLNLLGETPFSEGDIKLFKHVAHLYLCGIEHLEMEGIGQFTNLESLRINSCSIKKWIVEPFLLPNLKQVELNYNTPSKYATFQKLLRKVVMEQYPFDIRCLLFYLLAKDKKQLDGYNTLQLIGALVCDMIEIQAAVEREIENRKDSPLKEYPLTNKSLVYITGKLHTPVAQIKERLKAQGIRVTNNLEKETTHVIIGIKPKENLEALAKRNITLLIEKHVTDFLNQVDTPCLMEENSSQPAMVNNVIDLLMSGDETNQLTGTEILKTGGVTPEILTHLAALKYLNRSDKVRNAAKTLINQYGSPAAKINITKNIRFEIDVSEPTIYTNINKVTKGTELDGSVFALHLFRKIGVGRKYLLDKGTSEMRKEVIEKSLNKDGTKLDLADIQFSRFPEEIFDFEHIREMNLYHHQIKNLPTGIGRLKNLVKLNFYGASLENFPEDFFTLPSLKKLFIAIEDATFITPSFSSLKLEELYVFYTKGIRSIPKDIFQISTLKKLAIAPGHFLFNEHLLEHIPDEIAQLTNLEELCIDSNDLKELPASIRKLSKLNKFYVRATGKIGKETLKESLPPHCRIENSPFNLIRTGF